MKKLKDITIIGIITLILLEIGLRMIGYRSFESHPFKVKNIAPTSCIKADSIIGYSLKPGQYEFDYISDFSFTATHNELGYRFKLKKDGDKTINFYGGSLFYGFGLNDKDVFTSILSDSLPSYRINNFAIFGHSMVSSLVLLQEHIKNKQAPDIAFVTYANYNNSRNVYSRRFRENLLSNKKIILKKQLKYLYAKEEDGKLIKHITPIAYKNFPLRQYSAFMNLVETSYNRYEFNQLKPEAVDNLLIDELVSLCKKNNVKLIFAFVTSTESSSETVKKLEQSYTEHIDIHIDFNQKRYNLLPHDNHPNALAHKKYAEKIRDYLEKRPSD